MYGVAICFYSPGPRSMFTVSSSESFQFLGEHSETKACCSLTLVYMGYFCHLFHMGGKKTPGLTLALDFRQS